MTFQSTFLALLILQLSSSASARVAEPERRLSFERIVGYQPTTQVTDHAALDLDQQIMERELASGNLIHARNVYERGGHSYSIAQVTLLNSPQAANWPVGTEVAGLTEDGLRGVLGTLLFAENWEASADGSPWVVQMDVLYTTSDIQETYVDCQVGGLYTFGAANRNGCKYRQNRIFALFVFHIMLLALTFFVFFIYLGYAANGTVGFLRPGVADESEAIYYNYTYDVRKENFNGRFLKRLSNEADKAMRPCSTCGYYPDFRKFHEYYGDVAYAHKWIEAAFYKEKTNFENGRGNADFGIMDKGALSEAISKGSAYMSVLMYVIRELEDSMAKCNACESQTGTCGDAAVHSLDEAVAFYVGSLEGRDGSGDGVFMYNLADKRSIDFKTAGENSDALEGTSYINQQVIREFQRAQLFLLEKDCVSAEKSKESLVNLMKVPLVQGTLRYAFIREFENPGTQDLSLKAEAEGATFAAAVLPWVHDCDEVDADIIYDIMRVGSNPAQQDGFRHVKEAFERNYECLGITCAEVGGLWTVNGYAAGGAPCGKGASGADGNDGDDDSNVGVIVGSVFGVAFGLGLLLFAWWSFSSGKTDTAKDTGNIAAVSEIA
jgi:hypothetical protein